MFPIDATAYVKVLTEDKDTNHMDEQRSLRLLPTFESITDSHISSGMQLILVVNNIDLLMNRGQLKRTFQP